MLILPLVLSAITYKDINGGENDYATLTLFEDGEDGTIAGGVHIVGRVFGTLVEPQVVFGGWIMNNGSKITLTCDDGAVIVAQNDSYFIRLNNTDPVYLDIASTTIQGKGAGGFAGIFNAVAVGTANAVNVYNNIWYSTYTYSNAFGSYHPDADLIISYRNNFGSGFGYSSTFIGYAYIKGQTDKCEFLNNTTINCVLGVGALTTNMNLLVNNNIAIHGPTNVGQFYATANMSSMSVTNISSDGTADDNNLQYGGGIVNKSTSTLNFVDATAVPPNLHIQTGSAAENAGTDAFSYNPTDIDGQTLTSRVDIGADEITGVVAATPAAPSKQKPIIGIFHSKIYSKLDLYWRG